MPIHNPSKSLDRRDVLRLQADAVGRQPASVGDPVGVAGFVLASNGFDLVSGFAFFVEGAAVTDFD